MKFKSTISEFESLCKDRGIEPQKLHGDVIYAEMNPKASKKVCYLGGIHGNEKGGSLAVLRFLEKSDPKIGILLIPIWNPVGFERNKRRSGRRDPNRQWCYNLGEAEKALVKLVSRCNFLHTLHEDPDRKDFYLYVSSLCKTSPFKKLIQIAAEMFPITKQKTLYGDKVMDGMIIGNDDNKTKHSCSVEYFFEKRGIPYLTTETPGLADLEDRAECGRLAMEWVSENLEKICVGTLH